MVRVTLLLPEAEAVMAIELAPCAKLTAATTWAATCLLSMTVSGFTPITVDDVAAVVE